MKHKNKSQQTDMNDGHKWQTLTNTMNGEPWTVTDGWRMAGWEWHSCSCKWKWGWPGANKGGWEGWMWMRVCTRGFEQARGWYEWAWAGARGVQGVWMATRGLNEHEGWYEWVWWAVVGIVAGAGAYYMAPPPFLIFFLTYFFLVIFNYVFRVI